MSQAANQVSTIPPLPGGTAVAQMNAALAALLTNYKGHPAPSFTGIPATGQYWIDDTNDPTSWTIKTWDGAQWLIEGYFDPTNHQFYAPIGGKIATAASAGTVDLGAQATSQINITGTTTITSFGSTAQQGQVFFLKFSGALTLTNSGSLVLPGGANIVTAAGDTCVAVAQGSSNFIVWNYTVAGQSPFFTASPAGGGFANKFRNAGFQVNQRGTSAITVTTAGAYTADGWIVVPTGASCTATPASSVTGLAPVTQSMLLTGAASVTDILVKQRIEGVDAAPLSGQVVTVSVTVFNTTGGSLTPQITVKHANALDNWSASTVDVGPTNMQLVPASTWTRIAYTFTASANSFNGLEITFDFGNNFSTNGKTLNIGCADIRATPGVATGINNSPPTPEIRPYAVELTWCQRYFWQQNASGNAFQGVANGTVNSATQTLHSLQFPAPMRTIPSFTISAANTFQVIQAGAGFTPSAITTTAPSSYSFFLSTTVAAATAGDACYLRDAGSGTMSVQASAEL